MTRDGQRTLRSSGGHQDTLAVFEGPSSAVVPPATLSGERGSRKFLGKVAPEKGHGKGRPLSKKGLAAGALHVQQHEVRELPPTEQTRSPFCRIMDRHVAFNAGKEEQARWVTKRDPPRTLPQLRP